MRRKISMIKTLLACALGAALTTITMSAPAMAQQPMENQKPFLHPLFSEDAVLQRDRALNIWGWTKPNSDVMVKFDGGTRTLRADNDGRWSVPIRPRPAGGPYALEVSSDGQTEKRSNLMFGDVWLCSGQSNMEFQVNYTNNAAAEIGAANYPNIRLLQIPQNIQAAPVDTVNAKWQVCTPETVRYFSAVGYFFGRKLNQELNVPIGLINSSWGGTPAETWVSKSALQTMPSMQKPLEALQQTIQDKASHAERMATWWKQDFGTQQGWEKTDAADADWKSVAQPGAWERNGVDEFNNFDGVVWFRRTVDVSAGLAGQDLKLSLGAIDDDDTTYWNGEEIGATQGFDKERVYTVKGQHVRAGKNVVAIRVLDTGGDGGLIGPAELMFLKGGERIVPLENNWKMKISKPLAELTVVPQETLNQNSPTTLFNGMINPLLPGQIKGAIWYQGESNAGRAQEYRALLPTLILDWRARFGAATGAPMPFYIVQLANFQQPTDDPNNGGWAYIREAQSLAAKNVPDTGIAVITDIGDAGDIHPKNKQDVGLRLALAALHQTYGENIEYSGPTLKNAKPINGALQLTFDHAAAMTLKGDANRVFAVAGADKKWSWAVPTIDGNTITLHSPDVAAPIYARFAWSDNPRANLYNSARLPASPFRTDSD